MESFVLFFNRTGLIGVRTPEDACQAAAKSDIEFLERIAPALRILDESIRKTELDFIAANPGYQDDLRERAEAEQVERDMLWLKFFLAHGDIAQIEANRDVLESAIKQAGLTLTPANLEWALIAHKRNLALARLIVHEA